MSATYLGRPIFNTDILPLDWSKAPKKEFSYDLREILLGQAPPKFQPLAHRTVTGLQFEVLIENEERLDYLEAFIDSVKGRLTGFWFVSEFSALEILEPIGDGTQEFYIRDQQLRDTFTAQGYLAFRKNGLTQYGRISNCVQESGRERVTLYQQATTADNYPTSNPTTTGIDASWDCFPLRYVRLADDATEMNFMGDNWGRADLKVVELPEEYAALETGQQPVFLYELAFADTADLWRYTNLNVGVTSNDPVAPHAPQTFTSWPILHDGHRQALEGGKNTMKLSTVFDASSPVAKLFPYPTPSPLSVTVWEISYGTPDTRIQIFSGIVESAKLDGAKAELSCVTMISALGHQFPRFFIQNRCNYCLFTAPCGLNAAEWRTVATVTDVGARHVKLTVQTRPTPPGYAAPPVYTPGFFAFGYLELRHPVTENKILVRTIESNLAESSTLEMVLTAPMPVADMPIGSVAWIYPGCDGTKEICRSKFFNFANWGGHNLTSTNLSINAVALQPSQNKK